VKQRQPTPDLFNHPIKTKRTTIKVGRKLKNTKNDAGTFENPLGPNANLTEFKKQNIFMDYKTQKVGYAFEIPQMHTENRLCI
jgi:hypothetical protein